MTTKVDVVVLTPHDGALHPEVARGLADQRDVQLLLHRVVGEAQPHETCRYETIARMRNEGKLRGNSPWLMFVDHDVVLEPNCISALVGQLTLRPIFAALAADYLEEHLKGEIARHVAMGATLFRREALDQITFDWEESKCDCQCCCDDLRRLHWGIDYCSSAKARHLPKGAIGKIPSAADVTSDASENDCSQGHDQVLSTKVPSVCLVVCFFGPPPGWINHYLLSCAYNPSIDFLLFTDQDDFPVAPPNVRVLRLSMESFDSLASSKTGVRVELSHPRKVCDFKPAYGHLFEEYLEGWDYWGYTDFDVIYGDIRQFLSEVKLQDYDVYTARQEYLVGHFTLFRNDQRLRTLYQQSVDYRSTMQSPHVMSFDECGNQWGQRLRGEPLNRHAICDSMTHVVHRMMASKELTAVFSPAVIEWPEIGGLNWRLCWQNGRLWVLNQHREVMYFHFHAFKDVLGYREPKALESNASFEMSSLGFEPTSAIGNWIGSDHSVNRRVSTAEQIEFAAPIKLSSREAGSRGNAQTLAPRILAVFDRRHLAAFCSDFLASLRGNGNNELVMPVAVGLYPSEQDRLAQVPGVQPVYCSETGEHLARRRLREFLKITRSLPPETPVAYWDAGDVVFQSRLAPLWDLIQAHSGKLLAAREPCGYPDNPVIIQWTEGIIDSDSRQEVQQIVFTHPFINGGFLAGTASTLTKYFEEVTHWYNTPKLAGSGDLTDQLALNLYCHTQPKAWQEIEEGWNYCLWGRKTCYRREDGSYIDTRGVPIHIIHGNAHSFEAIPLRRQPF